MLTASSRLSDWLKWLETLSPKEIDLGLERVNAMLQRMSLSMPRQVFLVAGTNGKGSSVAMLDSLLRAHGHKTGAYTSPHVLHYNERIVINGQPASDDLIVAAFAEIESLRDDIPLTYFEYGTLAAALIFAQQDLDAWVLEVGLGGRLDATNAFEPSASLITNIALDHCDWLGDDTETIAAEKAGVMRADKPCVFASRRVPKTIADKAIESGAQLLLAGRDFTYSSNANGSWDWQGKSLNLAGLQAPRLRGEFQIENAAAVLCLLESVQIELKQRSVDAALSSVSMLARMQEVQARQRSWLLDVAHNPAASEQLGKLLAADRFDGATVAIVGILADKDVTGLIEPLAQQVDRWIAVTADSPRAIQANELARQIANATGAACLIAESFPDAVQIGRHKSTESDRILVTGSFFTVAPVLNLLKTEHT